MTARIIKVMNLKIPTMAKSKKFAFNEDYCIV